MDKRGDFPLEILRLIDPSGLEGKPVPMREWIWEDYIPVGSVTALYGDGGAGKSLLAQQLMAACATGSLFLGQEVTRCQVVGVFCEDDEFELHRRQVAINRTLEVSFADLGDIRWLPRVGNENLLMTFNAEGRGVPSAFYEQILKAAREFGARLVVIDTAADTFAGNENARPEVRQFISSLTKIAMEINGAVILLAHPSQTGKASGSGDGGSTAWNNSVRSRLYLRRPDQANGSGNGAENQEPRDPDARILSRQKANYAAAGVEIPLKFDRGAFVLDDGAAVAHGPGRNRQAEKALMAALGELETKGFRCNVHKGQANFAPKAMRNKTDIGAEFSEAELAYAMDRLIRTGRIKSVTEGPISRRRTYLKVTAPDLPET